MTRYIIRIPAYVFLLLMALGLVTLIAPNKAFAQYRGAYPGQQEPEDNTKKAKPEYPQIFSSQVSSIQQASELDKIYDGLYTTLWNYAISDFNYQKQLYELMRNERFQITRYASEFSGLLEQSMENLNENHAKMQKGIEEANRDYKYIRGRLRSSDKDTLDELWPQKIEEYKNKADEYFKMQHEFLKTYHTLVAFVLAQGGGYYYNSQDQTLRFYKHGVYEYYGKSLDKMRKITYEQKKLLKSYVPVKVNPALLK